MFLGVKKLDEYEQNLLRDRLYASYQEFVSKAAKSRSMTYSQLLPYAQGRAWMGEQAIKYGLVDKLGGMDLAIELAKQKAGIDSTKQVKVVVYTTKKNWIEKLLSDPFFSLFSKNLNFKKLYETWQTFIEKQRVLTWPMMPYRIRIH